MTFRTRCPRKNNAPRLDNESITSVNCGSRPHHCLTTSRVAADQRAWPTTGCSTSPARTWRATASASVARLLSKFETLSTTNGNVVSPTTASRMLLPETCRKDPASLPRMPTATISASGRRYRGLSAEERKADQRERLVRAAINEFSERGYHRTSVEDIVRSAHTSRTAFYAFFENREAAMYSALEASLRGLLDSVRKDLRNSGTDKSLLEVGVTAFVGFLVSDPAAGAHPVARRHRHVTRGERAAQRGCGARSRRRCAGSGPTTTRRPRTSPQASAVAVGVFGLLLESMLHLVGERPPRRSAVAHPGARHRGRADARTRQLSPTQTPNPASDVEARHRHAGADPAPARPRDLGGDGHVRRRRRASCRRPTGSATTTARAPSTSRSRSTVAETRGARYWDPLATFGALGAHTSTHPVRRARARARLPPSARDREAIRDARRGHRRARDPRRRGRIVARGVRSARRAVRRPRRSRRRRDARAARVALAARARVSRRYFDFAGFVVDPHARQARVPLWVGGRTARSLRRAVELGEGWAPFGLRTTELGEMLARARDTEAWAARDDAARRHAAERAPARSRSANRERVAEQLARFAEIGATGCNVRFVHHSPDHYKEQLAALANIAAATGGE